MLLLGLRRKGPGLWWTALCVTMALGVTLGPATIESLTPAAGGEVVRSIRPWVGVQIGGIASPTSVVGPETWGLLFLAVEMLLLHRAIDLGKPGRLYAMVPLFLLWANVDETFAFGLVALAASVVGLFVDSKRRPSRPSPRSGLIALGLCVAATFVNPSHVFGVVGGFGSILRAIGLDIGPPTSRPSSLFGAGFAPAGLEGVARSLRLYYAALVGIGLASFLLNRRDFVLGRFLVFVVAAVLWALAFNAFTAMFAVVLAASMAINGQEWYHRAFGTEGRLGAGWTVWSTGGRLLTIAVVFAAIARGVTGWGGQVGDSQFGFGFNPDDFPFESAEAIKEAPIEGNILNTSLAQGDAIAWKAASKRKAFVDSRNHLYTRSVFDDWSKLRFALRDDDVEKWQPVLDRYKISAVMVQLIGDPRDNAPRTYARLMNSPNWIPFYDDGAVAMFGRADANAQAADLAYFKANRLDAAGLVYKSPRPVPPWERPPTATWELVDSIFQNRLLNRPQPHTAAALRWLNPANVTAGQPYLADPAHCLMAIREARIALSSKPDDSTAFQILIEAYERLLAQESALILGISPTAENLPKIAQAPSQGRYIVNRNRQLLAVLNFRLETLPPSKSQDDQAIKTNLNYTLAQLYLQGGALDLALERLGLVSDEAQASGMNDEFLKNLTKQRVELNQRVEQVQSQMQDMAINRRATPLDKAKFARANGAPGLAIPRAGGGQRRRRQHPRRPPDAGRPLLRGRPARQGLRRDLQPQRRRPHPEHRGRYRLVSPGARLPPPGQLRERRHALARQGDRPGPDPEEHGSPPGRREAAPGRAGRRGPDVPGASREGQPPGRVGIRGGPGRPRSRPAPRPGRRTLPGRPEARAQPDRPPADRLLPRDARQARPAPEGRDPQGRRTLALALDDGDAGTAPGPREAARAAAEPVRDRPAEALIEGRPSRHPRPSSPPSVVTRP